MKIQTADHIHFFMKLVEDIDSHVGSKGPDLMCASLLVKNQKRI